MSEMLDKIAERYAKKAVKNEMRKISKIVFRAVSNSFKEGWLESNKIDITPDFCKDECKMWNTEYRCRECTRNEFD